MGCTHSENQLSELVVCALAKRSSALTRGIIAQGMCSTGLHASLARGASVERSSAQMMFVCSSSLRVRVFTQAPLQSSGVVGILFHRRAIAHILDHARRPCCLSSASWRQVLPMGVENFDVINKFIERKCQEESFPVSCLSGLVLSRLVFFGAACCFMFQWI